MRYREGDNVWEAPLAMRAVIKNDVTVQPAVCAFFLEKTLQQHITLTDLRKRPLTVTRVETTARALKAEARTLPGGLTKITIEASGAGLAPGRHDEMLDIYTDDSLYAHLQVPITLFRQMPAAVLVTPDEVGLLVEPGHAIPSTLVRLRPRGAGAVVIDKVVAEDPAVKCTWAAGPGSHATLKIQVHTTQALNTAVRVHLREPAPEIIAVPVRISFP